MKSEDYAYRVIWSQEDNAYIATCAEFPSLSCVEDSQSEAFFGIIELVKAVLEDMEESGEIPPQPFATRAFSGKFDLRIPAEQHVSLNQLIVSRL
jgi:predicted RNase H-like HicB family nuclease